ncbi:MAG TPA: YdeI/OmpD-associated family protein [Thermoanaerobaculia bacterium]|jgi:uncharacterized protein YdeI (YjbR/CyaY-like superfamily)|nr:YdeI/OmpD-associated family protein [Thermoanaerobaculia bacterium]
MKTLHVTTREDWRAWLAAHHETETEIWIVYYKQHTGQPRISYDEVVEEALCFGWIDSLVRRLDDDRYAQKVTPRKNTSKWSESNLRRFAVLVKDGRVTAAGLAKGPPDVKAVSRKPSAPLPTADDEVPEYIRQRLQTNAKAWRFFQDLAPSYRRLYVKWIDAAKRDETRSKRLDEAVALLEQGKKLGLK